MANLERFEVIEAGRDDTYYYIRDNQYLRWNTPERATTINFGLYEHATKIAEILNRSWQLFLKNPY
jgi:hypothetical protein